MEAVKVIIESIKLNWIFILVIIGCLYFYFRPCLKERDDSELHSRNRYNKTAELEEQLRQESINRSIDEMIKKSNQKVKA